MSKGRKVSKTVADVNWDEGLINAVVKDVSNIHVCISDAVMDYRRTGFNRPVSSKSLHVTREAWGKHDPHMTVLAITNRPFPQKNPLGYKRDFCSFGNDTLCISCPLGMGTSFQI